MTRASVVALVAIATIAHAERAPETTLAISHERLPNGLEVVLAPDPTVASVVVHVRYEGGAGDERADERGFTSIVERLAFAGSVHVRDYELRIDANGGFVGAAATLDHLSVWEQVPAGALDLALFLEAERMAGLADGMTDAAVTAARDAVNAAYRSAYVDQPYGLAAREVQRALWPDGHRNRAELLGDGVLAHATRDRLRAFVRARMRPNNATLVVVGNFDADKTSALVRRYFAWIPGGARSSPAPAYPSPLTSRVVRTAAAPVAQHVVAYRLPEPFTHGWAVFEILAHAKGGELTLQRGGSELRIPQPAPARALNNAERVRSYQTDLLVRLEGLVYRAELLAQRNTFSLLPKTLVELVDESGRVTQDQLDDAEARWLAPAAAVEVRTR